MNIQDVQDRVSQHHVTLFGVEGAGGVVRDINSMQKRLTNVEAKANVLSGKWLVLMTLLAILGQFLARFLVH